MGFGSYEDKIWTEDVEEMDWATVTCKTVFCLFGFWANGSEVQARVDAVEEIKESMNYKLDDLSSLLTRLPDLEKGLVRIHYGRVPSLLPPPEDQSDDSVPAPNFSQFSKHYPE